MSMKYVRVNCEENLVLFHNYTTMHLGISWTIGKSYQGQNLGVDVWGFSENYLFLKMQAYPKNKIYSITCNVCQILNSKIMIIYHRNDMTESQLALVQCQKKYLNLSIFNRWVFSFSFWFCFLESWACCQPNYNPYF